MRNLMLAGLGAGFIANGLMMLFASQAWYDLVPGVSDTGPMNFHFVRDIGCAYLTSGISLLWLLRDGAVWPAAFAAGIFLALHALLHVWDTLAGRVTLPHLASDAVLVMLPAVIVLWLAWPRRLILE